MLKKIIYKLLYGGSLKLSPLETHLFASLSECFENYSKTIFLEQVNNIFFVQREHQNRITRYTVDQKKCAAFKQSQNDLLLATIKFSLGTKAYEVRLITYKGYIATMESHEKISDVIFGKNPECVRVDVVGVNCQNTLSNAIDGEEHGQIDRAP